VVAHQQRSEAVIAIRWLAVVVALLLSTSAARAGSGEIVVSLNAGGELLPDRVCVHAAKIGSDLGKSRAHGLDAVDSKPRLVERFAPECAQGRDVCNLCPERDPSATGGVVCVRRTETPAGQTASRDLQLQLDNAAIHGLRIEGSDLVIDLERGDGAQPRVKALGGAYYPGLALAVETHGTVELALRSRCVERRLIYSTDPGATNESPTELSVAAGGDRALTETRRPKLAELERNGIATLLAPEPGHISLVTLRRGRSVYQGRFTYPSNEPVELLATEFQFSWRKNCFVLGRRQPHAISATTECPAATLVKTGVSCDVVNGDHSCEYTCRLERALPFPTPVRFNLQAPAHRRVTLDGKAQTPSDLIVWEDEVRFPGDQRMSFTPSAERRVYLNWGNDDWKRPGREVEGIDLSLPDGSVHRLSQDADSLNVPGLHCPATFNYRYAARQPGSTKTIAAKGDRLDIPTAEQSQQSVVLGLHAHGGTVYHHGTQSASSFSPMMDIEITALISRWMTPAFLEPYDGRAEISLSGTFTQHPSVLEFGSEPEQWTMSPQVKTLLFVGYRLHLNRLIYLTPAFGAGHVTRALANDWSKSRPDFVMAGRVRWGYDMSDAVAIELPITLGFHEEYARNHQDAVGPRTAAAQSGLSLSAALGLQWADVF
jgi:hypothetical protein